MSFAARSWQITRYAASYKLHFNSFEYSHGDKIVSVFLFANGLPAMMCPLLHYVQVITNTTRCSPVYPSVPQYVCWRFDWPRVLWRGSAATRVLALRSRIPPGRWISVFCRCCVLSGRGLCVGLIARQRSPTECSVSERDREASIMRPWPTRGCFIMEKVRSFMLSVTQIMQC
jgi:hypothetical protein